MAPLPAGFDPKVSMTASGGNCSVIARKKSSSLRYRCVPTRRGPGAERVDEGAEPHTLDDAVYHNLATLRGGTRVHG